MDRREFLSFGRHGPERLLELSCERLHVRWVHAQALAALEGVDEEPTFESGEPHIVFGTSLRSTPSAIVVDDSLEPLHVSSPLGEPAQPSQPIARASAQGLAAALRHRARSVEVRVLVERGRRHVHSLHAHPETLQVYARPLLRALMQGLSIVAPEVALAAIASESGREFFHATHVEELLARGPSTGEVRRILHDLEPTLEQLGHREAREVLETLLARTHPLLGDL